MLPCVQNFPPPSPSELPGPFSFHTSLRSVCHSMNRYGLKNRAVSFARRCNDHIVTSSAPGLSTNRPSLTGGGQRTESNGPVVMLHLLHRGDGWIKGVMAFVYGRYYGSSATRPGISSIGLHARASSNHSIPMNDTHASSPRSIRPSNLYKSAYSVSASSRESGMHLPICAGIVFAFSFNFSPISVMVILTARSSSLERSR